MLFTPHWHTFSCNSILLPSLITLITNKYACMLMRNKQFLKMTIFKKDLQYYAVYNVGVQCTLPDWTF